MQTVPAPKKRIIRRPSQFVYNLWQAWRRCHQLWKRYPRLKPAAIGFAFYCAVEELFEGKRPAREPWDWLQDPQFWETDPPPVARAVREG